MKRFLIIIALAVLNAGGGYLLAKAQQNHWIAVVSIAACTGGIALLLLTGKKQDKDSRYKPGMASQAEHHKKPATYQPGMYKGQAAPILRAEPVTMVKPVQQPEPIRQEEPEQQVKKRDFNILEKRVKLAGTAKVKARQVYLRKIDQLIEPFDCGTFGINQTEYKGEPAFEVYAALYEGEDKVIGMIPAERVNEILKIYDRIISVDVDVYGGPEYEGDEKYYGAAAILYYEEKSA